VFAAACPHYWPWTQGPSQWPVFIGVKSEQGRQYECPKWHQCSRPVTDPMTAVTAHFVMSVVFEAGLQCPFAFWFRKLNAFSTRSILTCNTSTKLYVRTALRSVVYGIFFVWGLRDLWSFLLETGEQVRPLVTLAFFRVNFVFPGFSLSVARRTTDRQTDNVLQPAVTPPTGRAP